MRLSHTVLVVDDEPDVVQSVKDLLGLEYRVLGATSAAAGMNILAREEVHVVMTDQRMPGMTGVEFLHHIRGAHPEAIRLLFTGYADIRAVIDAINQGNVFRYIPKPWDPDELMTILREAVVRYDLLVERKRLVAELQTKNQELEDKNAQLSHADALKQAFIDVASHELRTPLTLLTGFTGLALMEPMPQPLRGWLLRIDGAAQRLRALVLHITKRLAAGQFDRPLLRQPVDLGALLGEALEEIRPFAAQRQQELRLEAPEPLGALAVERDMIRDSLHGLLMNAVRFTPDHGRVTLAASRTPAGGAEIRVTDTGIGIPREHQPLLFKPFFTGLSALNHSSGSFEFGTHGVGLGLCVAKQFIEMHGGTIRIESEPGKGTTARITLPPGDPA